LFSILLCQEYISFLSPRQYFYATKVKFFIKNHKILHFFSKIISICNKRAVYATLAFYMQQVFYDFRVLVERRKRNPAFVA